MKIQVNWKINITIAFFIVVVVLSGLFVYETYYKKEECYYWGSLGAIGYDDTLVKILKDSNDKFGILFPEMKIEIGGRDVNYNGFINNDKVDHTFSLGKITTTKDCKMIAEFNYKSPTLVKSGASISYIFYILIDNSSEKTTCDYHVPFILDGEEIDSSQLKISTDPKFITPDYEDISKVRSKLSKEFYEKEKKEFCKICKCTN